MKPHQLKKVVLILMFISFIGSLGGNLFARDRDPNPLFFPFFKKDRTVPSAPPCTCVIPVKSGDPSAAFTGLFIDTNPTGANVYLKGEFIGNTPISDMRFVSGQTLTFTLKKENFEKKAIKVTLQGEKNVVPPVKLTTKS